MATPLQSVRQHCLECTNGDATYVRQCPSVNCDVHPIRSGRNGGRVPSVLKAIRQRCMDCCQDEPKRVRDCELENCVLYTYRFGTTPRRKGATKPKGSA